MNINTDGVILLAKVVGIVMAFGLLARLLIRVNRKRDEMEKQEVRGLAAKGIPSGEDLDTFEDRYGHFAVPAIGLEVEATDEDKESTGRSRIGGRPDLPASFAWPLTKEGAPMSFLAQFDLQQVDDVLPRNGMPRDGQLYFFARCDYNHLVDGNDGVECAVLWDGDRGTLRRRDYPKELAKNLRFSCCSFAMREMRTYPDPAMLSALGKVGGDDDIHGEEPAIMLLNKGSHLTGAPMPMYGAIEFKTQWVHMDRSGDPLPMEQRIEQEEALEKAAAREWTLLLQLESEPEADMDFNEQDRLYFMIRRSDLVVRDFSRVLCHMRTAGPDHWIRLTDAHPRRGR